MSQSAGRRNASVSYDEAVEILDKRDPDGMRVIAADEQAEPELLFYLAATGDEEIRSMIARNSGNHFKADEMLSDDDEPAVRGSLVGKLVDQLSEMGPESPGESGDGLKDILRRLAEDQAVEVRRIVAQEVKSSDFIPADVARTLANDIDEGVCCPVLEESPLLQDEDLIAIIQAHVCKPALTAIARREIVSEDVSGKIADTMDPTAVAALLENVNAQIRESTLDSIIDVADDISAWHAPLALRPGISDSAIVRIADFVADGLLGAMCQRAGLGDNVIKSLKAKVDLRIAEHAREVREQDAVLDVIEKDLVERHAAGSLTAGFIAEAAEKEQHGVVWVALALLSGTNREFTYRVFKSGSGKAITSLTWLSNLPAWLAVSLQSKIGGIPDNQCLRPPAASDFPLSSREMRWQLDLFGHQNAAGEGQATHSQR